MGSFASVHSSSDNHKNNYRNGGLTRTVYCKKHPYTTVTHVNEKTQELLCLNCVQNNKRRTGNKAPVHEIETFVQSIQFKQTEIQTLEKLRSHIRRNEQKLLHLTQIRNKLDNKKKQMLEDVHLFVKTVIELLKHFEEELCNEIKEKIVSAQDELTKTNAKLESHVKTCKEFAEKIETIRLNSNVSSRLHSVLEGRKYMDSNPQNRSKIKEYDPTLKLNKTLSLSDITGKGRNSHSVRLGYLTVNIKEDVLDNETLSDISELSEETDFSRSSTQRTSSIQTSSTQQSRRGGDTAVESRDGSITVSTRNSQQEENHPGPSNARNGEVSRVPISSSRADNKKDEEMHTTENSGPIADQIVSSDRESTVQRRAQFVRDSSISRHIERRVSYGGTSMRLTPTPRRSSQSIISPGNISTSFFPTPRRDSMARRIAVKVQEIKLRPDREVHNITDTLQVNDKFLVLCDQRNEKLILLNEELSVTSEVVLKGHPHNVAKVPGTQLKIAVTIPDENVVKIVEVEEDQFSDRIHKIVLKSKPRCLGIDYIDGNMIYTTRNDVAIIKKNDTNRAWKFKYAFREPVSLCADTRNDVVFISCLGLKSYGEVVKMHYNDEKIDFIISCPEIQHPVCTTFDAEGFIYVCDCDPPSVHQVSQDGRYIRRLLNSSQGKFQHVHFLKDTSKFIVTENDSSVVSVYEMA